MNSIPMGFGFALLALLLTTPSFAQLPPEGCEALFDTEIYDPIPSYSPRTTITEIKKDDRSQRRQLQQEERLIRDILKRAHKGISERGFISAFPSLTPELASLAAKEGLMWWGLKIYSAPSIGEAKRHSAAEPNPLRQGVYAIGQNAPTHLSPFEAFEQLISQGRLVAIKDDKVEIISSAFILNNFDPSQMEWVLYGEQGPFLYQPGWCFPKQRGVILEKDTLDSTTYKKTRRLARSLIRDGWRITFNQDFKQSLDHVRDQKRKEGDQWIADSRYKEEDLYNTALEHFSEGKAFSVEVWNEKGELVGGLIGNREDSLFSPDSVFYDHDHYPKISIGFAKIAVAALVDRLAQAGIPFLDSGMVTDFTASMKGRLIPAQEFLKRKDSLPSEAAVDLSSEWKAESLGSDEKDTKDNSFE